jgi:putative membrane protein
MNVPEERDGWQRLHPATPFLRSLQFLYAFAIGAIAASTGVAAALVVLLLAALLIAAWITLAYLRFRYRLTEESLVITHGVLFRQRRVIPRSRIQNVDLRAGLVQQLLGVTTARIETAGGRGTEATLHVVGRAEGVRLRATLLAQRRPQTLAAEPQAAMDTIAQTVTEPVAQRAEHDTFMNSVTPIELVIAGATANRAGLLVGLLLGGDYLFDFMPTDWLLQRLLPPELVEPGAAVDSLVQTAQHNLQAFLTGLVVLALLFVLAGWAISVVLSVVRYFDFTLRQSGGQLQFNYGLFTRREKGFRRSRVQNVQIEESILRRWLGLASLRVQTAGYGPQMKSEERMETLTPIARKTGIPSYLTAVYPDLQWENVEWRPAHPRARRRLFIRRALAVVLASGLLALWLGQAALLLLVALAPAWLLAAAHYRHLGHARSADYMLLREGLWNRRTYIVPIRKIQALHLRQSPFQRRLGLGTLHIETAGNPYEWHAPRAIDLGTAYARECMEVLAVEVTATGLTF